jgi:nucleoside-diphosphate-sugar epimerase
MRILIAGATGAIGQKLVPALVAGGHEVTGTSRSVERASELVELGATPALMDALDPVATAATVAWARPDVIVHQLTALPKVPDLRKHDIYAATERLRREGTANLIAAAQDAGVKRVVAQSIAFAYAPEGGAIKDEDAPLNTGAPAPFGATVEAVAELEERVTRTPGIDGIVLRYGWLYGPGTYFAPDGFIAGEVARRRYPLIGSAKGISSFIHTEDAAGVTVAAIENGEPGIYNAVDDEPLALSEWLPVFAKALGAPPPRRIPRFAARLAAGPVVAEMATEMRGASNARAKRELDWIPRYPSVRDGFAELRGA